MTGNEKKKRLFFGRPSTTPKTADKIDVTDPAYTKAGFKKKNAGFQKKILERAHTHTKKTALKSLVGKRGSKLPHDEQIIQKSFRPLRR